MFTCVGKQTGGDLNEGSQATFLRQGHCRVVSILLFQNAGDGLMSDNDVTQ